MDSSLMHIKVRYQEEVRRFQCQPNFALLETTLRQLFSLGTAEITIKYLDDENDWCSISTQMELEYATSLPQPIKLVVTTSTSGSANVTPAALPVEPKHKPEVLNARLQMLTNALEHSNLPPHRVRQMMKRQEMLQMKLQARENAQEAQPQGSRRSQVLQTRLDAINKSLEQPNLPLEDLEHLTRKKENLTAKLAKLSSGDAPEPKDPEVQFKNLQSKLVLIHFTLQKPNLPPQRVNQLLERKKAIEEKLQALGAEVPAAPVSSETDVRNHLLQQRLAMINSALQQPNLPPHRVQNLNKRREALEAKIANPNANGNGEGRVQRFEQVIQEIERELATNPPPFKRQQLTRRLETVKAKLERFSQQTTPSASPASPAPTSEAPVYAPTPYPAPATTSSFAPTPYPPFPSQSQASPLPFTAYPSYPTSPAPAEFHSQATPTVPTFMHQPDTSAWNKRVQILTAKLAYVNTALDQPDLPPQKLAKLNQKKETLEAKLEAAVHHSKPNNGPAAHPHPHGHAHGHAHAHPREKRFQVDRNNGKEHLKGRLEAIDMMLAQPNLPEQKKQNLMRRREMILSKLAA